MQAPSDDPRTPPAEPQPFAGSSELPPELLHEILVRLPPDDLIRCLSVSKPWNSFVRQPSFIKSHLRRSLQTESDRTMVLMTHSSYSGEPSGCFCTLPFEDDDDAFAAVDPAKLEQPLKSPGGGYTYSVGNSVDGLLCLVNHQRKLFALWNPSIQKFKSIPFPTTTIELPKLQSCCYGFGYDSVNDDYKLAYITFAAECLVTYVYSLNHNSWKTMIQINMPRCCHDGYFLDSEEALFSGGALCWMMRKQLDDRRRRKYVILTFDLATEEYVEFRTPVDVYQLSRPTLVVLGAFLCILVYYCAGFGGGEQDVWIMKEYGVAESWTLLGSMVDSHLREPLAFSKNRERVLLLDSINRFFWYDLREKISRQVDNPGLKDCYKPTICVRSLCLLDDADPVIR